MKTLLLVSTGRGRPYRSDLARMEASEEIPRTLLFEEELNADIIGEEYLQSLGSLRGLLYRYMPSYLAQIVEAFFKRKSYDAIITWGEHLTLLFALLLKLTRNHVPHIALMYWISPPKKALLLRLVHPYIDRIITWSSFQRRFAVENLGIPPSKVEYIKYLVDQKFWAPIDQKGEVVSAVGNEQRDYVTLVKAVHNLDIPFDIIAGRPEGQPTPSLVELYKYGPVPSHIKIGWKPLLKLREQYARSRFVVVPLHQTETNHGLTVILEAMAMGKPVICSHTIGHEDVILPGETGIFVPLGDPLALRSAIISLWERPEVAERMGKAARHYVEKYHSLDGFVAEVKRVVEAVIFERSTPKLRQRTN